MERIDILADGQLSVPDAPSVRVAFRLLALAALFLALPACSSGDANTGVVMGVVRVDGQPAETGSIAFFPVDGKSSTAGAAIENGNYTATVPLGPSKVEIRVSKKTGERKLYDTPDSPVQPIMEEVLPPKYNDQSELTFDVQPGENPKDFELSSND